jgi:RHS repeat-associated protein
LTTRAGSSMSCVYDAVGNRIQRTDYNGVSTTYSYDNLNRLTTIVYPTRTVTYGYDPLNNLTRAINENGTIYINYDNRYRVSSVSDPFFYGISYNYDTTGNRTWLRVNGATYATYTYDAVNRLTNLADSGGLNFTYSYNAANRLTSRTAPNGVISSYAYDALDRLTSLMHTAGATTLSGNIYTYNNANNISSWTTQSAQRAYTYDAVDRLTGVANFEIPTESYSYDAVDNRTASHLSATYGYQPVNKMTNTVTTTYGYDSNGNLISKSDASGTTTYTFNEENQLTQVAPPSGLIVNYRYDGLGRRIQRTTSVGGNERYVYDGHEALIDLNADWSIATTYFNDLGIDNHLRQTSATTGVSYFLTDHLGSTSALADTAANVVEQLSFDSFGNRSGTSRTRYGYAGRERDPDTGMLYYRARFYDPQLGRFLNEDPIGVSSGQINFFAYVGNNPVNSVDPMGLWGRPVHMRIINEAFACLNAAGREALENVNDEVDGLLNGGAWLEEKAYQHGMRAPYETVAEAKKKADDWINEHMSKARELAPNGCRFGAGNIPRRALEEFGLALHTLMDMTSPSHVGFQVWHGVPYPTGITALDLYRYNKWKKEVLDPHSAQESITVFESDRIRRQAIIDAARDAFQKAFGDCCCTH